VDPLFDRIETLFKSFFSGDSESRTGSAPTGSGSGDPDLDDAMAELDADLSNDREAREKLEREREARRRAEASRTGQGSKPAGPPARILDDYATLGLRYGVPFADVKAAYKRLLKEHHPDRHGASPERQREATARSARINDAYRRVEHWATAGKLSDGE